MTLDFDHAVADLPELRLSEAALEQHLRMITGLPARRIKDPIQRRRWALILAAVVGLSGAGVSTAAAFGFFSAAPTDLRNAHCYSTDDTRDPAKRLDIGVVFNSDGTNVSLTDAAHEAVDTCAVNWSLGRLTLTDPTVSFDPRTPDGSAPVPPLIACVLNTDEAGVLAGQVGVFAGEADLCNRLGLDNAILN